MSGRVCFTATPTISSVSPIAIETRPHANGCRQTLRHRKRHQHIAQVEDEHRQDDRKVRAPFSSRFTTANCPVPETCVMLIGTGDQNGCPFWQHEMPNANDTAR